MAIGAFAGCTCVETCKQDTDCKSGRCAVAEGVCTFVPDGGSSGGTAGGRAGGAGGGTAGGMTAGGTAGGGMTAGGGATGGGSTGGGMTGGGTGGGRPPLCDGGCPVWAACIDDSAAGVCEPGILSVTTPVNGGSYSAGIDVSVLVTLLIPDGGAPWPTMPGVSIPVATTWGRNVRAGSGMAVLVAGAADAGPGVLMFGWDAGPGTVERSVTFTSCESARCQPWQECIPTVGGGRCENLPLTVSVTMPANDSLATKSTTVPFQVTVASADAGRLPDAVPVVGPGLNASVARDSTTANTYTTTLTLGAPDGVRTYVAGWDAGVPGLIATRSLTYDGTAPGVTVEVQPPMRQSFEQDTASGAMNAWKKDEAALVAVRVTDTTSPIEPVTTAMVTAPGAGMVTAAPG